MRKRLCLLLMSFLLMSCHKAADVALPVQAPQQKRTSYDDALSKLGKLTRSFKVDVLRVHSKPIGNETGGSAFWTAVPVNMAEMFRSAVNKIGGNVVNIAYDPEYMSMFSSPDKMAMPNVVITGAITELDDIEARGRVVKAGAATGPDNPLAILGNIPAAFSADSAKAHYVSSITLDMNLMDPVTLMMFPKVQALNTMKIFKGSNENEFVFSLLGASIGISGSIQKSQGTHATVRMLVELCTLELLGKHLRLPYWKCIDGAHPDKELIDIIAEEFREGSRSDQVVKIQRLLSIYGVDGIEPTGILDTRTRQALEGFRAAYSVTDEETDEGLYKSLFVNVPVLGEQSRIRSVDASKESADVSIASVHAARENEQGLTLPQAGGRPPESEPRSFKVTYLYRAEGSGEPLPIRHGEVLNSNNLYKIVIKPDRDCFVYIFQLDSAGKVFQLFPMRTREQNIFNVNPVKMNQLYMLPSQDKSFKLDEQAGVEKIYLFVTERADPRLENLMFELDKHKAQRGSESMDAFLKDNAMNFKSRGLERIADDEPVQVSWKGSESLYTAMQHRLDGVSKSCMNVLEFRHVKVGESSD